MKRYLAVAACNIAVHTAFLLASCQANAAGLPAEHNVRQLEYPYDGPRDVSDRTTWPAAPSSAARRLLQETSSGTVTIDSSKVANSVCKFLFDLFLGCSQRTFRVQGALLELAYSNTTAECTGDSIFFTVTGGVEHTVPAGLFSEPRALVKPSAPPG